MKLSVVLLSLALAAGACKKRPERPTFSSFNSAEFVEDLEPTDTYLSIGTYLQKELDKPDNDSKVVKIYALMRQEASLKKNFALLRSSLKELPAGAQEAIDAAEKAGFSTVEFEVEIGQLKPSLAVINRAVSSMEVSLYDFKE